MSCSFHPPMLLCKCIYHSLCYRNVIVRTPGFRRSFVKVFSVNHTTSVLHFLFCCPGNSVLCLTHMHFIANNSALLRSQIPLSFPCEFWKVTTLCSGIWEWEAMPHTRTSAHSIAVTPPISWDIDLLTGSQFYWQPLQFLSSKILWMATYQNRPTKSK